MCPHSKQSVFCDRRCCLNCRDEIEKLRSSDREDSEWILDVGLLFEPYLLGILV